MLSYLFVVAHPDDEILGAGGTIVKLVELGHKVSICSGLFSKVIKGFVNGFDISIFTKFFKSVELFLRNLMIRSE